MKLKLNVYDTWLKTNPYRLIDTKLKPFLNEGINASTCGWILQARKALCLSSLEMGRRLHMSRSTYWRLERRERKGTITLNSIRKIAEVMDCEFVYAIRPKSRTTFGDIIWNTILPVAEKHPWVTLPKRSNDAQKYFALKSSIEWAYSRLAASTQTGMDETALISWLF